MFSRRFVFVTYMLAVLLAVGIVGQQLWSGYRQQTQSARATVENLAWVLHQRLDATLRRTDATLEFLVHAAREEQLQQNVRGRFAAQVNQALALQRVKFPEISAFRYIDANGDLLYTSDPVSNFANLADRPYFRTLRDNSGDGLAYSDVQVSRFTGQTVIVIGRAIRSPAGKFLGAAIAVLDLASYQNIFASLDIGPHGLLSIRREDSRLVIRHPAAPELVNKPVSHPIQTLIEKGELKGTLDYVAQTDGVERLFAFQRVSDYPFYFIVGLATDDYLAQWRNQAVVSSGVVIAALALFSWLLWHLSRAHAREVAHAARLEERELVLQDALQAAKAANRAKSAFLATMSHEIRTPMNGVLGMAQMLLDRDVSTDERIDFARTIYNSGRTLLAILNDILDLSKVEAGKLEIEKIAFCPAQLLSEIQSLFTEMAKAKGVALAVEWRGDSHQRFLGDPTRLRQILSNLVSNAIKFSENGRVELWGAETGKHGSVIQLSFHVVDTGMGISAESQRDLFQPFTQLDSSVTRRFGGTGLGLAIARGLVERMNGEIGVESKEGEGSTFWFTIEVDSLQEGEESRLVERDAPALADALHDAPRSGQNVLVVEDNPTNQKVILALLSKQGCQASVLPNGQAAVDAIKGGLRPDLILMDIQMPILGGMDATRQIREWETAQQLPHLPIVALTAGAFDEDRQNCLAAGMNDFLTKPINIKGLLAVLAKWGGKPA